MKDLTKPIAVIVLTMAVLGYTIYNYVSGKTDLTSFLIFAVLLGIPLVNMVNILIQQWKNKQ